MSWYHVVSLVMAVACGQGQPSADRAEPWQTLYQGGDAQGPHVLGLWAFDVEVEGPARDSSSRGQDGQLEGAVIHPEGRFASALESFPGWPAQDIRHAAMIPAAPHLSPKEAFTFELWAKAKPELRQAEVAYLLDKKYVDDADYQWLLESADSSGKRRMEVNLGFGDGDSSSFESEALSLEDGGWHHLAFSYDGAGMVRFFFDGQSAGEHRVPGRGRINPGKRPLSIGDRLGSRYFGFPGWIDQVRLCDGSLEYRPLVVQVELERAAFVRGEPEPILPIVIRNLADQEMTEVELLASVDGIQPLSQHIPSIPAAGFHRLEYRLDTRLRPDSYSLEIELRRNGETPWRSLESIPLVLVPRALPHRMPVVMWGLGGIDGVLAEIDRLKSIGFSHCLGLSVDYSAIWKAGQVAATGEKAQIRAAWRMLDQALANDLGIVVSLSPGHWLAEHEQAYLRADRQGKPYSRPNINGLHPKVTAFCEHVGESVASDYAAHPAFQAALIHTEVRDGTQLSFQPIDREAYKAFSGNEIPEQATGRNGVDYEKYGGFPADRVVPDDHPLLEFYRWFWSRGDGWNGLHTAVHKGLKATGRKDLWTFHDPAVRVPSLWGSGGSVDVLSQWTYSYPEPIRIALPTDELFAMAAGSSEKQRIMKMTQIIWYRSQTAPSGKSQQLTGAPGAWEDQDPDASYITIAPMHLKEAFWTKLSRPIQGIMYHGWGSLVPGVTAGSYRYTHPETQHQLQQLVHDVVRPLGPTLMQVPPARSDVAFLESFTSQMLARRGSYGWSHGWSGDAYLILQYAQLQPEVLYEETILRDGLEGYRVLVLADCDVLPASVVQRVLQFQKNGGLIIGDERLCPAIKPDALLPVLERTRRADSDKSALLASAQHLREQLDGRYQRALQSDNPEVITYRRVSGSSSYVFAVNDRREFGDYVGQHGLVQERGLDARATLSLQSKAQAFLYDLTQNRELDPVFRDGLSQWPVALGPGDGRVFLVTDRPIRSVEVKGPESANRGGTWSGEIAVLAEGGTPVDAIVPLKVDILDPDGRAAEFSGYHGAQRGSLQLKLDLAPNDVLGIWEVRVKELASGRRNSLFFRLVPGG